MYQGWHGQNLTSSNGRKHVRQYVRVNATGNSRICPEGWYRIAQFELAIVFDNPIGSADYKVWYLSSDRMPGQTQWLNGQSMHSDWFGAWDYEIMRTWMLKCNGITIPSAIDNPANTAPGMHECTTTQYGDGRRGVGSEAAPDGSRNPQLNLTVPRWTTPNTNARFEPLPGAL